MHSPVLMFQSSRFEIVADEDKLTIPGMDGLRWWRNCTRPCAQFLKKHRASLIYTSNDLSSFGERRVLRS
jgi:hypothetical protein